MSDSHQLLYFPRSALQLLINQLRNEGYCVVGPTIDQEAIVYSELHSIDQLPQGWTEEQSPGHYRLKARDDDRWFGFNVGPHSCKKFLFPPRETILSAELVDKTWEFRRAAPDSTRYALLGVRACELAAISIQDKVFLGADYEDANYRKRREGLFIVAVNCTQAASTCFCSSMKTGPECRSGFDIALTELDEGFLCETGSAIGLTAAQATNPQPATEEQINAAAGQRQQAVDQMTRRMDTSDLPGLLLQNLNHPRWDEVGERCLSCTNCTMVCPTCFCSSVTDVSDLATGNVDRTRTWDSCFNPDFSYCSGSPVRNTTAARYRQWLTHKLDSWHTQFDSSGCVGCGRCITWCPVGIDLTEEVAAIRQGAST